MEPVTPGWRYVHIGFEGDEFEIRGIRVWGPPWISTGDRITVAHPQHSHERHPMWTYRIEVADRTVEFVAGEFSNGVWGFFVRDRGGRVVHERGCSAGPLVTGMMRG